MLVRDTAGVQHCGMAHRPHQQLGKAPMLPGANHHRVDVGRQRRRQFGRVPVLCRALHLHPADRLAHLVQQRLEQLVSPLAVQDQAAEWKRSPAWSANHYRPRQRVLPGLGDER
jgi:hypothetical protein